jgi:hypothetical protein
MKSPVLLGFLVFMGWFQAIFDGVFTLFYVKMHLFWVLPPKFRTNKMHTHSARRIDQHKPVNNRNAFTVLQDRATLESDPSGSTGFAKQMRIVKWLSVFVFICFGKRKR